MPDTPVFSLADLRLIAKALRGYRANRIHKGHLTGARQLRRLERIFTLMADRRERAPER